MAPKIIAVTHHIPVEVSFSDGAVSLAPRKGHSALYSGLKSFGEEPVIHVGWVGDTEHIDRQLIANALGPHIAPVYLDKVMATDHYAYCKTVLWPLFHYVLWDSALDVNRNDWKHYQAVNKAFADAILEIYNPGDTIWIHDYHLLLLPNMLRSVLPTATIGLFLHTPFPTSELFRCLPRRQEILHGMLGANLIGFQTYSYARHFISTSTRVLGLESSPKGVDNKGFQVAIEIFPIGIDVQRVETKRSTEAVKEKIASMKKLYAGKKIILGRDKVDHIKGVQHKLQAFEKFLVLYPEWRNKVVLIQVTTPPQRDAPRLETKVTELVSRINGIFGSLEFVPVHHYHHHLDPDDYFALLSVADVGLITSVRDGMNTTSHEFVVCQHDTNHGPLILSEFAGTAGSLGGAMLVNPWDYSGVAHTLHEALTQSEEEKLNRHNQLYSYVLLRTAKFWARSFIKELRNWARIPDQMNPTPHLDFDLVCSKFTNAKKRMLLFDYDGTLTPIVKVPSAAHPPVEMMRALEVLCADPRNYVFIISGRDQIALENWLGHIPGLGLSAEHGSFIKYPGESGWHNLTEQMDLSWKNEVTEVFEYYTERTAGSFIEHKKSSITWHYRQADPDYGIFQAKECQNHLESSISKMPIEVLIGKKNLEVRPIAINKGEIVKGLLNSQPGTDFVICAGDDKTDEDMFKALKRSDMPEDDCFTVTIGSATKKTKASWHVVRPEDLNGLLAILAETTEDAVPAQNGEVVDPSVVRASL
ncbi:threalose-6-phosphate phosphatase [Podochytrium sp. JEL0797]|nr:threalose-6-phosphate phosphatase [Podochytrium sp. JEL0797]